MNSLFNIFRKKPSGPPEADKQWLEGYQAFQAGKQHVSARRDQEAVDCFDRAVECGFENAELYSLRAGCLQSLEWHIDAIEDFTKAISLEPKDCNLYFQRAMSKTTTGDQSSFHADIQNAISLSKLDNALNRTYNQGAKEMGWPSAAAMYEGQAALSAVKPDFIIEKNIERTKLRGRRKGKLSGPSA